MKILGINHDMYITSAALIVDGKIVAACPEERINRIKNTRAFPSQAIDYCLKKAGLKIHQIDYIANAYNPAVHMKKFHPIFSNFRRFRGDYLYSIPDFIFQKNRNDVLKDENSEYTFQKIKLGEKELKIYYITHHLCHAANGFYLSPFSKAGILTADGAGEDDTVNFLRGEKNKIKLLKNIKIPHSIGSYYSTFTEFFGYKGESDEWKIMALSAYGKKNNKFYSIIKNMVELKKNGEFELKQKYFKEHLYILPNRFTSEFVNLLGKPKKKDEKFKQKHYDIAWAMQKVFEEICSHMLKYLHSVSNSKNLVLSGGSFMNSLFNGKAEKLSKFDNAWISSCPDDSGLSIGAALYLYNNILGNKKRYILKHNYFGHEFSDKQVLEDLKKYKLIFVYSKNTANLISKELQKGKLIGWFQGSMEFGQRSLGNRSILADPRNSKTKDFVNKAVKYRENFRPFAPSVLDKYANYFFNLKKGETIPFMEKVVTVKKDKIKLIPAVVHNDGTARVQVVNEKVIKNF